jgi:two-component system, chemotaxis family, protein-glutamate methylesterase/glutaminase
MTRSAALPPTGVVIGVSAGAFDALSVILPRLPDGYPPPVMVVVHLPPDKKSLMADLFAARCKVAVKEAEDKEPLCGGTVYFAPPDYHLLVEADGRLSLSSEEPVHFSRPSVDVLFESAADAFGPGLVGVVLTGANGDGAKGLKAVHDAGGVAVVQRPDTAQQTAMPLAALGECPAARAMTLDEIADYLNTVGA